MRSFLPLFVGALGLFACRTEQVLDVDPVSSVELGAPYLAISPGEVHQLLATLRDIDGNDLGPRSVRWRSLDPSFVTVDDSGKATGVAVGVARLVASSEGRADTIELPVKATWARVWAGSRLVCAERITGGTWCWGDVPGDGTTETRLAPVSTGKAFGDVRRGLTTTCGLDGAAKLWCWSSSADWNAQFGNGADTASGPSPRSAASGTALSSFGLGYYNTCGVTTAGEGLCWGSSIRFGIDSTQQYGYSTIPAAVLGGHSWRVLLPGEDAVCGLTTSGQARCFGGYTSIYCGECAPLLGLGETLHLARTPTPVVGAPPLDSLWVSNATACGTTPLGELYCWGRGVPGGGTVRHATPVLAGIEVRSASLYQSNGCVVDTAGRLWCWTYSSPPVSEETTLRFTSVALSEDRTCAVTSGGGLYCQGGTLVGDGGRAGSDEFVRVEVPE